MLDWLAHRTRVSPQKTALIYGDEHFSYARLNLLVAAFASRLAGIGVVSGKHVAVLMPNRLEYVYLLHALARLNAVLVPLNIRLTTSEIEWQVDDANCDLLVCSVETETQAATLGGAARRVWSVDATSREGVRSLGEVDANDVDEWHSRPLDVEAVQGIVYTSGTTGQPKGAMLTYANHLWSATASGYRLGVQVEERWLVCMPLYHVGGQAIVLRCCLYGTTVVLQDGFEPEAVSEAFDNDAVTLVSLVPTMLRRLLDIRNDFPTTLRGVLLGGAAAPAELIERSLALDLPIALTYGLTEAASQVATAPIAEWRRKPQSVGKPLLFADVRIVGVDGEPLAVGEIGEIVVSGPSVMRGYYEKPEATKNVLRDGVLHTGDLGYLDEDGDLWVLQRRTDLIVSGGENIYPVEVEQVLLAHPGIREVCVVGIDDSEWGQRVAAVAVRSQADLSEDDLVAYCREHLAAYKLPRVVRFVDGLPRTASGKVRRDIVARELL